MTEPTLSCLPRRPQWPSVRANKLLDAERYERTVLVIVSELLCACVANLCKCCFSCYLRSVFPGILENKVSFCLLDCFHRTHSGRILEAVFFLSSHHIWFSNLAQTHRIFASFAIPKTAVQSVYTLLGPHSPSLCQYGLIQAGRKKCHIRKLSSLERPSFSVAMPVRTSSRQEERNAA
ncbi:hypothetical protein AVEN_264095-1 [Araneus ventricosus]|uniref:Uncharacterized protein n=1 Tax=Araneus ventricosus TaxID=182803 RepID=A0A4Y2H9B4_ARAVE|nr:hypothetical protein AVEN_264095-1 [Araneus ventricosus]